MDVLDDDAGSLLEDDLYEVEKILDMKEEFGMRRFLIKWKNYDESENTWEPEDYLSCPELLEQFLLTRNEGSSQQQQQPTKTPPPAPTLRIRLSSPIKHVLQQSSTTATITSSATTTASITAPSTTTTTTTPGPNPVLPVKRSLAESKRTDQVPEESVETTPAAKRLSTESSESMTPLSQQQGQRQQQQQQRQQQQQQRQNNQGRETQPHHPALSTSPPSTPGSSSSPLKQKPLSISGNRPSRDPRLAQQQHRQQQPLPTTPHIPTQPTTSQFFSSSSSSSSSSKPYNYTASQHIAPDENPDPISWSGKILGNIEPPADIQMISIPSKCKRSSMVKDFLKSSETVNGEQRILRVTAFIKTKVLEKFFGNRHPPPCLLYLNRTATNQVSYGKLSSFLQVNDVAALVHVDGRPTEVLAIVHGSDRIERRWELGSRTIKTLLGIYMEQMPRYPHFDRQAIQVKDYPLLATSTSKVYEWYLLLNSLQFPPELIRSLDQGTCVEIHGTSSWATMLKSAHELYKSSVRRSQPRRLLFDRSDDSIFKMDLYQYKRSHWSAIFLQFGAPIPTLPSIPPPTESFPRNSGGFLTTDVENMVNDPNILGRISDAVEKLNMQPLTLSKWRFVLKDDILDQLRDYAKGFKSAQKVQAAVIHLSILLSDNKCDIMRDWTNDNTMYPNASTATVKWAEKIVRRYHGEHEYFVLVDDIGTMKAHLGCLDQAPSHDLIKQFGVLE